jgi:hypothetical protein
MGMSNLRSSDNWRRGNQPLRVLRALTFRAYRLGEIDRATMKRMLAVLREGQ